MYTVTVISPAGFRDSYNVAAGSAVLARILVAQMIASERPNWRAVSAVRMY